MKILSLLIFEHCYIISKHLVIIIITDLSSRAQTSPTLIVLSHVSERVPKWQRLMLGKCGLEDIVPEMRERCSEKISVDANFTGSSRKDCMQELPKEPPLEKVFDNN